MQEYNNERVVPVTKLSDATYVKVVKANGEEGKMAPALLQLGEVTPDEAAKALIAQNAANIADLQAEGGVLRDDVNRLTGIVQNDLSRMTAMGQLTSEVNTANCYIVHQNGSFFLPLVYGNGIKKSQINAAAYTREGTSAYEAEFVNHLGNTLTSPYIELNEGCEAATCEVVWQDEQDFITDLHIVNGLQCRGLQFNAKVPLINANAIVAVKDKYGDIIWSWHIWGTLDDMTPYTLTNNTGVEYSFLPLYLGWKWDSAAKTQGRCCHYQWGRKDPMPVAKAYNSDQTAPLFGAKSFLIDEAVDGIGDAIRKPNVFFKQCDEVTYNWLKGTSKYNLWNTHCKTTGPADDMATAIKTIYDPCPAGFMLPAGRAWTGFTSTGGNTSTREQFNVVGNWNAGWVFKKNPTDTEGIRYPAAGCRRRTSGALVSMGGSLYVWSFAANSQALAYGLYADSGYVDPLGGYYRAYGFSVAPCAEY